MSETLYVKLDRIEAKVDLLFQSLYLKAHPEIRIKIQDCDGLSVRTLNLLTHVADLKYLDELTAYTIKDLRSYRGFGGVCISEVIEALNKYGMTLKKTNAKIIPSY